MSEPRPELFDQAADGPGEPDEVLDGVAVLEPAHARPLEAVRAPGALSPRSSIVLSEKPLSEMIGRGLFVL